MVLDRAIVPAAGFGTRMRPLTNTIPKEMLPVGRRPVIEHVLAELRDAGIRRVLVVIAPGKEIIQRHLSDGTPWGTECEYVVQEEMRGVGHAVLLGADWTQGRPFLVAFGDSMIAHEGRRPTARLSSLHADRCSPATG